MLDTCVAVGELEYRSSLPIMPHHARMPGSDESLLLAGTCSREIADLVDGHMQSSSQPATNLGAISMLLQGIKHGWRLPEPCNVEPSTLDSSQRLPEKLADAIRSFESPDGDIPGMRPAGAYAFFSWMSLRLPGAQAHTLNLGVVIPHSQVSTCLLHGCP